MRFVPCLKPQRYKKLESRKAILLLLALWTTSFQVRAQSYAELDNLIFEPVPLASISASDLSFTGNDNASPAENEEGQDSDRLSLSERNQAVLEYENAMHALEAETGPYSTELSEELLSLASFYQEQGDHENALQTFERAEHISRINYGLFSLDQVDSVEGMIESLVAMGDFKTAHDKQNYLVYIHEQHYEENDPRLIPILQNQAQWDMELFSRGIRYDAESLMDIVLNYGFTTEEAIRSEAFSLMYQAQRTYIKAIRNLLVNGEYFDPRLPEMENSLIETFFLQTYRSSIVEDPTDYLRKPKGSTGSRIRRQFGRNSPTFQYGSDAYTRQLLYLRANEDATVKEYVDTLTAMGDWYYLFGRRTQAVEKYQEVERIMESAHLPESRMTEILRPAVPVVLPTFTPTTHTREIFGLSPDDPLEYKGYIDVAFTLNKYGKAKKITPLDASPNTSRSVERRLLQMISKTQYRPRLSDGEQIKEDEVALRYYYTY